MIKLDHGLFVTLRAKLVSLKRVEAFEVVKLEHELFVCSYAVVWSRFGSY